MHTRMTMIACLVLLAGCGGGGGGSSSSPGVTSAPVSGVNVLAVSVDGWAPRFPNQPYVSVTLCDPSGGNCQTVDHVLVDTGSVGFRVMASVLSPALAAALPAQKDSGSGNPLAVCTQFATGYTWGPVRLAQLQLGGEPAVSTPIQVIDDSAAPNPGVPVSCSNTGGISMNGIDRFGARATLGIGAFRHDCGSVCATSADPGYYYACTATACNPVAVELRSQIQNPVALQSTDNNGVLIDLPALPAGSASSARGWLILGIGTRPNNDLGSAQVYTLDAIGEFSTHYKGRTLNASFIDSGSNGLFFDDTAITLCKLSSGFYCPPSPLQLSATIQGRTTGTSPPLLFTLGNVDAINGAALAGIGGPFDGLGTSFDWGLPLFYGRRIFTAIEGMGAPGGTPPYVAF